MIIGSSKDLNEEINRYKSILNGLEGDEEDISVALDSIDREDGGMMDKCSDWKELYRIYGEVEAISNENDLTNIITRYNILESCRGIINKKVDFNTKKEKLRIAIKKMMAGKIKYIKYKLQEELDEWPETKRQDMEETFDNTQALLDEGAQELENNAKAIYNEMWDQYKELQNEIKNPNSNPSSSYIEEELQYLGYMFALSCEYALKAKLLPTITERVKERLKEKFSGDEEKRKAFHAIILNNTDPALYFKILTGELSPTDENAIRVTVAPIFKGKSQDKRSPQYITNKIDKFITDLNRISLRGQYGHDINKMMKSITDTELENWKQTIPNFNSILDQENVTGAFRIGRYDKGLPNTVFLAGLASVLNGAGMQYTTSLGTDSLGTDWDRECENRGFVGNKDKSGFRKNGDKVFTKIGPKLEIWETLNEMEKKRLGWQMGLGCEYYIKSLLPIEDNIFTVRPNDATKEIISKFSDEQKNEFVKAFIAGDGQKQSTIIGTVAGNCTIPHQEIYEGIVKNTHNLMVLINGLDQQTRKSIIKKLRKKKLRKKKWNIINSGRDKTISLDSSVADAFEKGRYGLTGYQPDIENLSILLEACQEIASKEQNIMQQSQSRSSGTTVTATSIALADNIRGLTTTLVSKCRELLRNISKEIKGKEK